MHHLVRPCVASLATLWFRRSASHATRRSFYVVAVAVWSACFGGGASARDLKLLFLGDRGHHRPAERFAQLQPALAPRGIELTYTERLADLNPANLAAYAGLVVYANIDEIGPAEESALLNYVADGGAFVPIHCASYCFRNSPRIVDLVGAQFKRHGTGTFATELAAPEHPILQGFGGFRSWDETYVHDKHNPANRTVLEYRAEGAGREPWTWTRTHGKGRVFYTAWGHDARTWGHPGYRNLIERGIRWACGDDPALAGPYADLSSYRPTMTPRRTDVKPFEYVDAKVPFYPEGGPRKGDGEWNRMQSPLDPEESLKHYVHPNDFELRLFAAEPDIGKSLAMAWDERGRLWLCESVDYPNNLQEPGRGNDRIRICEDTDGDGRADRFTVFAEQLSIPTTLAFHRGGVVVQNATETLYLKDTDGDDRADRRRVLLTGWGAGDTHGGVSNFRLGPDGWLWGMQGYNNSTPTAPATNDRPERSFGTFRMGFFRFRPSATDEPVVEDLEFIRSTNNNTWGLGFSEEGHVFGSTANGNPSVFMPIANRYYEAVRGWSAPQLGGIAENNEFHPVTDKVRQVDHHHGFTAAAGHALYTARNYPRAYWNRTAFVCEPTGHLVATFVIEPDGSGFKSRNAWNLVASDDEWAAPIMAEVGPDGNVWVLDWYNYIVQHNPTPVGFTTGKGNAYETELRDKRHSRVFRVVPKGWKDAPRSTAATANRSETNGSAPLGGDAAALVRRLLRTADVEPDPAAVDGVLAALRTAATTNDRILLDAAICAAARNDRTFLERIASEGMPPPSAPVVEAVLRVAEHYARGNPQDSIGPLVATLGSSRSPYVAPIVEGLSRGWPKDAPATLSEDADAAIGRLLTSLPNEAKGRLVTLAERLGSEQVAKFATEIAAALLAEAGDSARPDALRIAAARQLVEFRRTGVAVSTALLKSLSPRSSPELSRGLLAALSESEVPGLGRDVVARLPSLAPSARPEAVRLLLARREWTVELLNALDSTALQLGELSLDQKQSLASHPDGAVARRAKAILARSGGLPNPDRQKVLDELLPQVDRRADAAAGKLVFTKQCAKCHMHSGEGQKIGPDLTGMAVHPKRELLVHLIDPNRSVEGNFRVYTVETSDGRVLTGLLAGESKTSIELIDAEAKRHALQRDDIETLTASARSLMPEGFEKQVSRDDLANLLEFLTTRGRFFPLDLRKAATAVSTRGMFYREDSEVERLIFPDWSPKTFAGVPFTLVDPQGKRVPNVVLLHSTNGKLPPRMPRGVTLPVHAPAKAIHLLSGVSGWGFPVGAQGSVSLIVRLRYDDGVAEDHELRNGVHFADYIRRVDVPESQFAFALRGQQVRYLAIHPKRAASIREVELVKGPDASAPIVMAVTVESR